jgi:hypothetical protein
MLHTPSDQFKAVQAIAPQAASTGADVVVGSGIDCAGYEVALFVVEVGAVASGADKSVSAQIQESSDNGSSDTFADLTGATTGAVANAGQNETYLIEVNLSEAERYLRVAIDGGSSAGGLIGVACLLMQGRSLPPTQQNTVVRYGFS